MIEVTELVSSVGFPIAISFYILFRLEKSMQNNTKALIELKYAIKSMVDKNGNTKRK